MAVDNSTNPFAEEHIIYRLMIAALAFFATPVLAGDAGSVASSLQHPLPASGLWYEEYNPGAGFSLEIQNERIAGGYFGFRPDGHQEWLVFSGALSVDGQGGWSVSAPLERASSGPCLGCGPRDRLVEDTGRQINLRFGGTTQGSFHVDEEVARDISLMTFGYQLAKPFREVDFQFPDVQGKWILVLDDVSRSDPWNSSSQLLHFSERQDRTNSDGSIFAFTHYLMSYQGTNDVRILGELSCEVTQSVVGAQCSLSVFTVFPGQSAPERLIFDIELASFGHSHIQGRPAGDSPFRARAIRVD